MRKRDLIILGSAIALALVLSIRLIFGGALETGNWGLSFQNEGSAPIGPANAQTLAKYAAAYLGDSPEKVLYLTDVLRELADDLIHGCPMVKGNLLFDGDWESKYLHGEY